MYKDFFEFCVEGLLPSDTMLRTFLFSVQTFAFIYMHVLLRYFFKIWKVFYTAFLKSRNRKGLFFQLSNSIIFNAKGIFECQMVQIAFDRNNVCQNKNPEKRYNL